MSNVATITDKLAETSLAGDVSFIGKESDATGLESTSELNNISAIMVIKTDAVLLVEGQEINVDRKKLSKHSPYFNNLFFGHFSEAGSDLIPINYDYKVVLACVQIVNDICPSNTSSLDDIEKLYIAADYFQLPVVKEFCDDRLSSGVFNENPITVLVMAGKHGLEKLKTRILYNVKITDIKTWLESREILETGATSISASDLYALVKLSDHMSNHEGDSISLKNEDSCPPTFNEKTDTSDVVLIARTKEIHVQKSLLVSNSSYFADLFSPHPRISNERVLDVSSGELGFMGFEVDDDYNVLLACVQIIAGYTPSITLTLSVLDDLLSAAERYSFNKVKTACSIWLSSVSDKPVDAFLLAGKYGILDIQNKLMNMITKNLLISWKTRHAAIEGSEFYFSLPLDKSNAVTAKNLRDLLEKLF